MVSSSVARLSAAQPAALLAALVERLQLQPQQAARLVPWLRSLLLCHGAALAAAPVGKVGAGAVASAADLSPGFFRVAQASQGGGAAAVYRRVPDPVPVRSAKPAPALLVRCCLQAALRAAHEILQERTACYSGLLGLSGRLQLLQAESGGGASAEPPVAAAKVRRACFGAVSSIYCATSPHRPPHPRSPFALAAACIFGLTKNTASYSSARI